MKILLPRVYVIGLAAWGALLVLQCAWYGWLFPPRSLPMWVALAVAVVPLLLPLFALRDVRRALLWVGMLSLFYFCHGVAESWSEPAERWLAVTEILLTLLIIGTLGAGVRRKPASI